MSVTKLMMVVKDTYAPTLVESDLTRKVGEVIQTEERDVPHSNGLKWCLLGYPAGYTSEHANYLGVFLSVNGAVSATCNIKVDNSSIQADFSYNFDQCKLFGATRLASQAELRPLFVNGKLSITVEVEFNVPVCFTNLVPRLAFYSDHVPTDFALVMDSNRLQVHKSILSVMSPVFYAMLSHDTAESRSGEVQITDFDFETVKTAIDFCYGREVETPSVEIVLNMLRFADKYDIKAVTSLLEKMPQLCLSIQTFSVIIHYADDFFKDDLFSECCKFFRKHQKDIVDTEKFATFSPSLVTRLLKQAFDLKTEFDVLQHAHTNGITFILDPLEQSMLESLSLDTFCDTVSYAWDGSRDTLKKACAEFFTKHLTEISNDKSFVNLSPTVVQGVMKLRCDILFANK